MPKKIVRGIGFQEVIDSMPVDEGTLPIKNPPRRHAPHVGSGICIGAQNMEICIRYRLLMGATCVRRHQSIPYDDESMAAWLERSACA